MLSQRHAAHTTNSQCASSTRSPKATKSRSGSGGTEGEEERKWEERRLICFVLRTAKWSSTGAHVSGPLRSPRAEHHLKDERRWRLCPETVRGLGQKETFQRSELRHLRRLTAQSP